MRPGAVTTINSTSRTGVKGWVGEGIYVGRRSIHYEDDYDGELVSPSLIDLY